MATSPPSPDKTTVTPSPFEINPENNPPKILLPDVQKPSPLQDLENVVAVDYSKRAQWLRAAVLGANDGLLSVASLMMGVGAVRSDVKIMILTGIAGLVAGACSMAIGEFVSVYSQYDIEMAQLKRETAANCIDKTEYDARKRSLPSPTKASLASAFAFVLGAAMPLVAAAFVRDYHLRLGMVVLSSTIALVVFGWLGAFLGSAPIVKSSFRVLIGGWIAMAITFGFTRLAGESGI